MKHLSKLILSIPAILASAVYAVPPYTTLPAVTTHPLQHFYLTHPDDETGELVHFVSESKPIRESAGGQVYLAKKLDSEGIATDEWFALKLDKDRHSEGFENEVEHLKKMERLEGVDMTSVTRALATPYIAGLPLNDHICQKWNSLYCYDFEELEDLLKRIGKVFISKLISDGYTNPDVKLAHLMLRNVDENGLPVLVDPEHLLLNDFESVVPLEIALSDAEREDGKIDVKTPILQMINAICGQIYHFTQTEFLKPGSTSQRAIFEEVYNEVKDDLESVSEEGGEGSFNSRYYVSDLLISPPPVGLPIWEYILPSSQIVDNDLMTYWTGSYHFLEIDLSSETEN